MTDATQDLGTVDDGFHEIHLSGKQLVFLFMATTVVSVLIFLLGVMVGRGVPVRQAADPLADPTAASAPASAPEAAPAPVPAPPPTVADAGPQAAEPPAPAPETAEDLSYKKRLESEAAAKESLKPRPSPAQNKPAAAQPALSASAASAQNVIGTPQPGVWIVQVHALRDRAVASGIVQRLVTKGYPAFLVAAGPPTGSYKVQVGRFKDRDEAQQIVERLKKEEQFNPWITR